MMVATKTNGRVYSKQYKGIQRSLTLRRLFAGLFALLVLAAPCTADPGNAGTSGEQAPAPQVRCCNRKSILVRYRWEGPAPAGVQMWIRLDNEAWLPWRWTDQPAEPIAFSPPREGPVVIALAPAARETADPPGPDAQTLTLNFDWEKPLLRLIAARPLPSNPPTLRLTWAAWDENLGDRPISLYWRSEPDEAWQVGATNLPNAGVYEWDVPAQRTGVTIELSLRAADLAGNLAEVTATVAVGAVSASAGSAIPRPTATNWPL